MNLPNDFGLSPAATMAHVADPTPAPWHQAFWQAWGREFWARAPRLDRLPPADPSDPGVTHRFESALVDRSVAVGCRLLAARDANDAPVAARAGVVVTHGYSGVDPLAKDEERFLAMARHGVAVLLVRVRGFAGSQLGVGPLEQHSTGYVTHGLERLMHAPEDAMSWVLPGAVADVANACRALASHLTTVDGVAPPISIRGESFGAGLAVVAAAQLAPRFQIHRMVLGVPTLGDWAWRLSLPESSLPRAGMGREIRELLIREGERAESIVEVLRLCDAAVHAPAVRCPVLVKLPFRDDMVPAPSQAAIFNALGSNIGERERFVVPYGHFDGGIANARRHAEFERCGDEFLNPTS
jgi:cephalosporin-C deacetylase-like acetyl esterase